MCAGCADWIAACETCGYPRVNPDGTVNHRYLRHYYLGDVPCAHVAAEHVVGCGVALGLDCDCRKK